MLYEVITPTFDFAMLDNPQTVQVRYDLELVDGKLNFVMVDTTPWPPGSDERAVRIDRDGNYVIVVERGQDRIFEFQLNPAIDWEFDPDAAPGNSPMTIKQGNGALYRCKLVNPQLLQIRNNFV